MENEINLDKETITSILADMNKKNQDSVSIKIQSYTFLDMFKELYVDLGDVVHTIDGCLDLNHKMKIEDRLETLKVRLPEIIQLCEKLLADVYNPNLEDTGLANKIHGIRLITEK